MFEVSKDACLCLFDCAAMWLYDCAHAMMCAITDGSSSRGVCLLFQLRFTLIQLQAHFTHQRKIRWPPQLASTFLLCTCKFRTNLCSPPLDLSASSYNAPPSSVADEPYTSSSSSSESTFVICIVGERCGGICGSFTPQAVMVVSIA